MATWSVAGTTNSELTCLPTCRRTAAMHSGANHMAAESQIENEARGAVRRGRDMVPSCVPERGWMNPFDHRMVGAGAAAVLAAFSFGRRERARV